MIVGVSTSDQLGILSKALRQYLKKTTVLFFYILSDWKVQNIQIHRKIMPIHRKTWFYSWHEYSKLLFLLFVITNKYSCHCTPWFRLQFLELPVDAATHIPLRGEPWGEAGGLECKEDAMDIVSSVCFLLLTSSDKLNDFCGEPVPMKTGSVTAYYSPFELLISV